MKHFSNGIPINLSKVHRERKLVKIQAKEVPTNQNTQEVVVGLVIQLREEKEEEEGETPIRYPDLS